MKTGDFRLLDALGDRGDHIVDEALRVNGAHGEILEDGAGVVLSEVARLVEPMPGRGLACRGIGSDGRSKRVVGNSSAASVGADAAGFFYHDLLAVVGGKPVQESLSLFHVADFVDSPPGRGVGKNGVNAFLKAVGT